MAAETSGDAKVPVALALAKLAVVFAWKNAEELKLIIGKLLNGTVLSKFKKLSLTGFILVMKSMPRIFRFCYVNIFNLLQILECDLQFFFNFVLPKDCLTF